MEKYLNLALVTGTLARVPEEIPLASGDLMVKYEVTVPQEGGRADTVPVVAINPGHGPLTPRQKVFVIGRTRRRFWSAGGATRSQVEVLAERIIVIRDQDQAWQNGGLVNAKALDALDEVLDWLNTEVASWL